MREIVEKYGTNLEPEEKELIINMRGVRAKKSHIEYGGFSDEENQYVALLDEIYEGSGIDEKATQMKKDLVPGNA